MRKKKTFEEWLKHNSKDEHVDYYVRNRLKFKKKRARGIIRY